MHNCEICKALNVKPLLRTDRSQLRWFGYVTRTSHERLARQVLLSTPTGKRPRSRPRTRLSDYISKICWCTVEAAEVSEIAFDRAVFRAIRKLLSPRPSPGKKRAWKCMINFFFLSKAFSWFSQICGSLYSAKCWGFLITSEKRLELRMIVDCCATVSCICFGCLCGLL